MNDEIKFGFFAVLLAVTIVLALGAGYLYFAWIGTIADKINPCFNTVCFQAKEIAN